MAYEVDFLPVGEGKKSGDAIAMRFGDFSHPDGQTVIVIDGGYGEKTGKQLAALIRDCYHTDRVDLVVSTHPDLDHIGGLGTVLDEFQGRVGKLLMHLPWMHYEAIHWVKDGRATPQSISENLQDFLKAAVSLEAKAHSLNVPIVEPFAGMFGQWSGGVVSVLGPGRDFYASLLPRFEGMPDYAGTSHSVGFHQPGNFVKNRDNWNEESKSLSNYSQTSARNDSSVILQVTVDGRRLLFTGDAGILALEHAANRIVASGWNRFPLRVIQVPHHGSRSNVGTRVLDDLVGPVVPVGGWKSINVVVSCSPDGAPDHPSDRVLNAFRRRGARCFQTKGGPFLCYYQTPSRHGCSYATPHEFQEYVQDPN